MKIIKILTTSIIIIIFIYNILTKEILLTTAHLMFSSILNESMIKNKIFRQAWAPVYDHEKATKRPRNIKRCISLVNKIRRFITRMCQLKII